MNIIGKIFVFAVFVMSLVFMSFAIALFSTHTNWREEITRPADQVQAGKPLGYKLQLDEAKKERETLTAEIAKLTAEVAASEAARDQIVAKIQTALGEKDRELQALRKDKDAREDERENAQTELAMTRTELEKATKTVEGLRDDIRGMQKKVQHGLAIESLPRDHVPTAGGVVTAVVDDSIEVTLGGDDGVQMGHFLEVYRDDEYLGRVQVISVKPDRSVGRVIREFKRGDIQPGDRVATRLKA